MNTKRVLVQTCVLSSLIVASSSGQTVAESAGPFTWISPPPSVLKGALESDTDIFAFEETPSMVLPRDLKVDIVEHGSTCLTGCTHGPPAPGMHTIAAGTMIKSYFFHLDPKRLTGTVTLTGEVDFKERILGVIVYDTTLDESDWLGASMTSYPTGIEPTREVDWLTSPGSAEIVFLMGTTFELTLEALPHTDQVRVITTPSPGVLSCVGVFLVLSRRRRVRAVARPPV